MFLFQISLLGFSGVYFYRTENKIIKTAILCFSLMLLGLLVSKSINVKLIGIISFVVFNLSAILLFVIYLITNKKMSPIYKSLLGFILLPVFLSYLFKVFHFPGYGIIRIFSIIPIVLIIYLNLKKLKGLREELRFIDLYGIVMLTDLLVFINKNWFQ